MLHQPNYGTFKGIDQLYYDPMDEVDDLLAGLKNVIDTCAENGLGSESDSGKPMEPWISQEAADTFSLVETLYAELVSLLEREKAEEEARVEAEKLRKQKEREERERRSRLTEGELRDKQLDAVRTLSIPPELKAPVPYRSPDEQPSVGAEGQTSDSFSPGQLLSQLSSVVVLVLAWHIVRVRACLRTRARARTLYIARVC